MKIVTAEVEEPGFPLDKALFAEIIIPLLLPKNYTWQIPSHFINKVKVGCRVEVALKNKKYAGILKKFLHIKPQAFEPKYILNVLDAEPVVFPAQLRLWEWIAAYYMCSEGEVMTAALPSYFKLSSETILIINEEYGDNFSFLDNDEFLVAEALHIKKQLKLTEVQQILDASHVYPVIKRLIEKRVCYVWESLKESYKPKYEAFITLNPQFSDENKLSELVNNWSKAPKQLEMLLSYLHLQKTKGEVSRSALLEKSGATDAQLKGLIEKNILLQVKHAIDRLPSLPKNINIDFSLSATQQLAFDKINTLFTEKRVCLLHGITSSGKTLLYIKLIEEYVKKGKQVLYLLPEIALTSQIIRRLQKHFGGHIGIYHSKFNQNERIEIWNKIKSGELKIVLGARSALYLPFENLGLIITDEEHDNSYKQYDPAPRYHARDSAIYYAELLDAKILLGSASPSIESYYNAIHGKYGFVALSERYGEAKLPRIEIVDVKKIIQKDKSKVILSPQLKAAIESSLIADRQTILFQNRRGYFPYQICATCGWIPQCKNCDVSLTFHKLTNKLVCHYCGTVYSIVNTCEACGSNQFIQKNFGTEKIEEYLEEVFPKARVARMDIDAVKGKHAHDNLIQQLEQRRIDILVGTQMVVKGLDFEHVNLVGIIDADSLLHFVDFRVNERAFQLMEQVSGRAGRKSEEGKVLIQVSDTKHPVLHFVQQHNYKAFFDYEIQGREKFFYPPFSRLILLSFRHKSKETATDAALQFASQLQSSLGKYIIGPTEPVINRIRNQYRMELLLKLPKDSVFIQRVKSIIKEQIAILQQHKTFRSVVIIADVDPA